MVTPGTGKRGPQKVRRLFGARRPNERAGRIAGGEECAFSLCRYRGMGAEPPYLKGGWVGINQIILLLILFAR